MTASTGMGGTPYPEPATGTAVRRLYRSRTNRTFAGVCAGIAEYYAADTAAVRLAAVLVALITGIIPGILVYLVAAIVIPERPATEGELPMAPARPGQSSLIIGILLVIVGAVALAERAFQVDWDLLWPVGLIAVGAVLAVMAYRR
jgi:phage shock protein C